MERRRKGNASSLSEPDDEILQCSTSLHQSGKKVSGIKGQEIGSSTNHQYQEPGSRTRIKDQDHGPGSRTRVKDKDCEPNVDMRVAMNRMKKSGMKNKDPDDKI